MCKKETFFLPFLISALTATSLHGEIAIGILYAIDNNAKVRLLYKNVPIECEPFGVIPLERMVPNAVVPKECSKEIDAFYRTYPHEKAFAREHLKMAQSYHFELIKGGCILYANGEETYSEMLLSHGIAVVDARFDNVEWNARLARAQKGAENQQIGLSTTLIRKFCIKEEK